MAVTHNFTIDQGSDFAIQFIFQEVPKCIPSHNHSGEAYALAYPIQGLLKYHGLSDTHHRLAFIPSISLNNDVATSITYVKFDEKFIDNNW